MRLQALREQKRTLAGQIRQMADRTTAEGYTATAEDDQNWAKLNADYNRVCRDIERLETAESAEAASAERQERRIGAFLPTDGRARGDGAETAITDQTRALAIAAWMNAFTPKGVSQEQADACRLVGFNPYSKELAISLYGTEDYRNLQSHFRNTHPRFALDRASEFKATMNTNTGTAGGYLIAPETLRSQLEINMLAFGGMRQVAETIRTATGEPLGWPTADDTGNTGVQLGEGTSIGSSVDPSFAKVLWYAHKFSSKAILVNFELNQDSIFNLPRMLGAMMGERLGRITNTKFTTGTGAGTAKGLVVAATAFSAASATAIAGDDLLGLVHSVDPAYRMGAGFMLHDSILLAIRKLKDGNGAYLWQSGLQAGVPDTLLGYGLTNNQDMDSTLASGKKTVLFGQLSKYKIRTVGDVRMYRLEERYRDTDQDGYIAFTREDGNLLDAGTAPVKVLTH